MSEEEGKREISFFSYEGLLAALERSNKRLLIALICTCATLIVVSAILIFGNAVNNKVWMQYAESLRTSEVTDAGLYEQSNPGSHQ